MKETVTYNFKPILNWYRLFHLELVARKKMKTRRYRILMKNLYISK